MAVIPVPFIISGNGIADSILKTVGLWVILVLVIVLISVVYGLLKGDLRLPHLQITPGKVIATALIAAAGVAAFIIHPLLLLPLLALVLIVLVYREMNSLDPGRAAGDLDQDFVPPGRYAPPKQPEGTVIDAEYRVIDRPAKKESPSRPAQDRDAPGTAGRKSAEEQRSRYEDEKRRELEQKLRAEEKARLQYIHGLYAGRFREYLEEAEKFRREYGKNVQCDVCGRWDGELFVHRSQTYCSQCLPPGSRPGQKRAADEGGPGAPADRREP